MYRFVFRISRLVLLITVLSISTFTLALLARNSYAAPVSVLIGVSGPDLLSDGEGHNPSIVLIPPDPDYDRREEERQEREDAAATKEAQAEQQAERAHAQATRTALAAQTAQAEAASAQNTIIAAETAQAQSAEATVIAGQTQTAIAVSQPPSTPTQIPTTEAQRTAVAETATAIVGTQQAATVSRQQTATALANTYLEAQQTASAAQTSQAIAAQAAFAESTALAEERAIGTKTVSVDKTQAAKEVEDLRATEIAEVNELTTARPVETAPAGATRVVFAKKRLDIVLSRSTPDVYIPPAAQIRDGSIVVITNLSYFDGKDYWSNIQAVEPDNWDPIGTSTYIREGWLPTIYLTNDAPLPAWIFIAGTAVVILIIIAIVYLLRPKKKNILVAFADPNAGRSSAAQPLNQPAEYTAIRRAVRNNKKLNLLSPIFLADVDSLLEELNKKTEFWIVHLSAHGTGEELLLHDGQTSLPEIINTLSNLKPHPPQCVILSACYTASHGVAQKVKANYVIAPTDALGDVAAIEFAETFYGALNGGIEEAFGRAYENLGWMRISDGAKPVLYGPNRDAEGNLSRNRLSEPS